MNGSARLSGQVSNESQPEIRLEHLAVCVLEIVAEEPA